MIFTFEIDDYKVKYGQHTSKCPKNYVYLITYYDSIGFLYKTKTVPFYLKSDYLFIKLTSLLKHYKYVQFLGSMNLNKPNIKILSKIFEDINEEDELFIKYKFIFENIENISVNTKLELRKINNSNKRITLYWGTEKIELTPYLLFNFLKNSKFKKWDELEKLLLL